MKMFKVYLLIACGILLLTLLLATFVSLFITLLPIIVPIIVALMIISFFINRKQEREVKEFYSRENYNNSATSTQEGHRVFNDHVREFTNADQSDDIIDVEAKEVNDK